MANILLFGGGLQSLSIARGLKENNHTIINISGSSSVGKYSNFIDYFHSTELSNATNTEIIEFINSHKINIIIPTEDEYAEWLSHNKVEIENKCQCKVAIEDSKLLHFVMDKGKLMSFCEQNQIPHPHTIDIYSDSQYNDLKNFNFPALIKPNISNGSRGIIKVHNFEEFKKHIKYTIDKFGSCTLQEYINNDHYYNVMMYRYADGRFSPEVITYISRYYPIKGGSSSFCTTIENKQISTICKKLLEKLNWIGFADFDVLENDKGEYKIIEINPRVPASVHAAYISNIDFGSIIVDDYLKNQKREMKYIPGKQLRCLGLDIAWFISSPNRFKTKPNWFKFWGKNLSYQEGGFKDLKAMLFSIYCGIKKQFSLDFRRSKAGMN